MHHFNFLTAILFLLSVFFTSCGKNADKEAELPPGILNKEQLTKILTDFALAESAATMNIKNANLRVTDSVYAFNPLKDNNVRQSQYDSSIAYYVNHTELYKEVYENVLVALSEIQSKRNPGVTDTSVK